ncbi:MAG: phosphate ABC transporter substrate-binding protein [Planctomycetaceae bacterium]|nr:phosphate ABC transporter substrate-binding protein [Planctomycetaceae bacterium]
MKRLIVVCLLVAVSGCVSDSTGEDPKTAPKTQKLVITGSSTVAPLAAEIAQRYEQDHPNVRIDVQTGGSSRGMADARKGLADIGMVSRAHKESERDLTPHLIAHDGLCLIVHATNPVSELTREQIIHIYQGQIENWKEVGGDDAEIVVVHKAEGRSTLELFLKHFQLDNSEIQPDIVIGDNQQGIKSVLGNPHAIGYVSIGAAEYEVEQGRDLKLLPLGGIEASTAHIEDGSFPLSRELNLVTLGEPQGLAAEFIRFAQSEAVHDLIEGLYFVPIQK